MTTAEIIEAQEEIIAIQNKAITELAMSVELSQSIKNVLKSADTLKRQIEGAL